MRTEATVVAIEDGYATVAVKRSSACASCAGKCGGCPEAKEHTMRLKNDIQAQIGERVYVESSTRRLYGLLSLLFLLPSAVSVAFYYIADSLFKNRAFVEIFTFLVLLGGFMLAYLTFGKRFLKKSRYFLSK